MKTVHLTQGKFAMVDDADFDRVNAFKWYAARNYNNWYAVRHMPRNETTRRKLLPMHRFIMDAPDGIQIDHRDLNGLNNTRDNLRFATRLENLRNRRSVGTSKYLGVHFVRGKWIARIQRDGKRHYLGCFTNEMSAAHAYDVVAKSLFGQFANLNFKFNRVIPGHNVNITHRIDTQFHIKVFNQIGHTN